MKRTPKPLTLGEVAAWVQEEGASLHISARDGKFLIVAHCAADHRNTNLTSRDLEHGLKQVMVDL